MSEKSKRVSFSTFSGKKWKFDSWLVVRLLAATILFIAAWLKVEEIWQTGENTSSFFGSTFFESFVVAFESLAALWLVMGRARRVTQLATCLLFALLAVVSFYKGVSGSESCGCFGKVTVNPWATFSLDMFFTFGAWSSIRTKKTIPLDFVKAVLLLTLCATVAGTVALATERNVSKREFVRLGVNNNHPARNAIVQLVPSDWIGYKCPLLDYCDVGNELLTGEWLILLYRPGCSACLSSFQKLQREAENSGKEVAVLCVEPRNSSHDFQEAHCSGMLSSDYDWFVETPASFFLKDGVVHE